MELIQQISQNALGYVKQMQLSDFADIAIMSYLIYKLLLLIRRTRSGQVAKAIVILIGALAVASFFHLNIIRFILNKAVELGLIALIILFQPELRRLLEQMGSGQIKDVFVREETPDELENAIVQTVAAYSVLAKDKVGALMVFERKNLLDDVLKSGTTIDAHVSAELLKNLFWNKAPMHDGAVIVRAGRVAGAGCMLPLSTNVNLSRDLGMRHRAGIGMSENSDAVVAIVSEETGSISVAIGGMLKRHLAPETLERLLRNELMPEEPAKSSLRLSGIFKSRKGAKADGQKDP